MKRTVISAIITLAFMTACVTMMGKWSNSKIDTMTERCLTENDERKPSTSKWHNLSTQARSRKKREMDDYRKKRIELYQSLDTFKKFYTVHVENDGKCRKNECRSLERIRLLIIAGCPTTGESFPRVKSE